MNIFRFFRFLEAAQKSIRIPRGRYGLLGRIPHHIGGSQVVLRNTSLCAHLDANSSWSRPYAQVERLLENVMIEYFMYIGIPMHTNVEHHSTTNRNVITDPVLAKLDLVRIRAMTCATRRLTSFS